MPFGRRNKTTIFLFIKNNIKILFSFTRTKKYIFLNLNRMKGSSHEIAIGLACGIAISFTPFLGLHALLAITFAWVLRGSMAAALIGTLFGNPWTFPFIWYLSYEIGNTSFENINNPNMPDRQQWANKLAYTEWWIDEIQQGVPWQRIKKRLQEKYLK